MVGVSETWRWLFLFSRSIFSGMMVLRMVFGVSWRLFLELVCYSALAFERSRWIYAVLLFSACEHGLCM